MSNRLKFVFASLIAVCVACAPARIGRRYDAKPNTDIKIGYHNKDDVVAKMGPPFRKAVDAQGREVFTYVWADGKGGGEKCVVAFNKNGIVYVVEVYP